jgi:hypothetical protein
VLLVCNYVIVFFLCDTNTQQTGGFETIVELMMADPRIDPTANDNDAIRVACKNGHAQVVEVLLANSRVNPSVGENTLISHAAGAGQDKVRVVSPTSSTSKI